MDSRENEQTDLYARYNPNLNENLSGGFGEMNKLIPKIYMEKLINSFIH